MADGLKQVWGLGEPKQHQAASTAQADKFKTAFQGKLKKINGALQYTSANGAPKQHKQKSAKRDKLSAVYQKVVSKIDPANPSAAQSAIDKALEAIRGVADEVVEFKDDVANWLEKWSRTEPEYDKAVGKVEQLEEWEDEQAEPMRGIVSEIRDHVNEKLFEPAVGAFEEFARKLNEIYEEAKKRQEQKESYEKERAAEDTLLTEADGVDHDDFFELKKAESDYEAAAKQLDELVSGCQFEEARTKLKEVSGLAKSLVEMRKGYDKYHTELSKVESDIDYVMELRDNSPPNDDWKSELGLYNAMIANYNNGKFDQAIKDMKTLQTKVKSLKKRVAEHDKKAKPAAEAAEKELEKLTGGKSLSSLSSAETDQLVEKLKKLKPEKQRQLLVDLHGPSTALTDEQRLMQRALYSSMQLDEKFKKEDKKTRDQYHKELKSDKELQNAVNNWNKTKDGQPVVDLETKKKMIDKILKAQSKAYGIDVPKVDWYTGSEGDFGGFQADKNLISLNTFYLNNAKEMIDTVIHENTHNYQDELAKQFVDGKIKKTDPRYEQAKTFAMLHHWDAYVPPDEDSDVYKIQPEEMQAWDAGGTESTRLLKSLKKPPKKGGKK